MKVQTCQPMRVRPLPPLLREPRAAHRILVVEDDNDIRHYVSRMLARSGYQVEEANDGAMAWENLRNNDYDLMITDNNMPRITGLGLLKMVHAARMDMPVIMATGTLPAEQFNLYPWILPAAILLKPYSAGELLEAVQKVLAPAVLPTYLQSR